MALSEEAKLTIKRILEHERGEWGDNLCRAEMQKRADPTWQSGNGETIDEVIAGYKQLRDAAQKALDELGCNP